MNGETFWSNVFAMALNGTASIGDPAPPRLTLRAQRIADEALRVWQARVSEAVEPSPCETCDEPDKPAACRGCDKPEWSAQKPVGWGAIMLARDAWAEECPCSCDACTAFYSRLSKLRDTAQGEECTSTMHCSHVQALRARAETAERERTCMAEANLELRAERDRIRAKLATAERERDEARAERDNSRRAETRAAVIADEEEQTCSRLTAHLAAQAAVVEAAVQWADRFTSGSHGDMKIVDAHRELLSAVRALGSVSKPKPPDNYRDCAECVHEFVAPLDEPCKSCKSNWQLAQPEGGKESRNV